MKFATLDELLGYVDSAIYNFQSTSEIVNLLLGYRSMAATDGERINLELEIASFMFDFIGSKVFPFVYSSESGNNKPNEFPELNNYDEYAVHYIKSRAELSRSYCLKARYFHLLWQAPKGIKSRLYANNAIDNYLKSIGEYYSIYLLEKKVHIALTIVRIHEISARLSNEVNASILEVKALTKSLVSDRSQFEFAIRHSLINDMLTFPKIYEKEDFFGILTTIQTELDYQKNGHEDSLLTSSYLPTAIRIAAKVRSNLKYWQNELGEAIVRKANKFSKNDQNWVKAKTLFDAMGVFRVAGNKVRLEEIERLYSEIKPEIQLNNISIDLRKEDLQLLANLQDFIGNNTNILLQKPPNEIYSEIANGFMFPTLKHIIEASQSGPRIFNELFTTIQFDRNKNVDIKEKQYSVEVYRLYDFQLNNSSILALRTIFLEGIKFGKLTIENCLTFLTDCSWIGKSYKATDLAGGEYYYCPIDLIRPALIEFFYQIQAAVSSTYFKPNFILAIDSLTLKIEGLIRSFCLIGRISVSIGGKNGMKEMLLNDLIEIPEFKAYFSDDDLFFLNFLLLSEGMNVRNNVAHSFYFSDDYQLDKILLLLAALLRIGKYNIP